MYYIYKIENKVNHKIYIGLTDNIDRRKRRHFGDLKAKRHDNHFLQKEYNDYGKDNFTFEKIYEGDITEQEIGDKERYYIAYYDSYHNGYNQNEGGNFGASNGGTKLIKKDIMNILSALEFCPRPGQVLSNIYGITKTTITRIKQGVNHCSYKNEYDNLSKEKRLEIYNTFCKEYNFWEQKANTTVLVSKRKFTEQQVHLILCNDEYHIMGKRVLASKLGVASKNTLACIIKGNSYRDYYLTYQKLTQIEKNNLVSLLREQ